MPKRVATGTNDNGGGENMALKSIDLHGVRAAEVVDKIDRFIMQANEAGFDQVRIMTGKGTGTVKTIVTDYLKLARYTWRYEKLSNGKNNEGVLIVAL
jgi:DNA mismatch repair protein MutS2